jgi:anaerobic magnesium-protoporphyrin IX monomethyl ester cyclase
VPWMCTEVGRATITQIARERARTDNPNFTRVVRITRVRKDRGKYKVYNFQCSPHDNYFAEHLLVHNCCIQAPFKSGERAAGLRESANSYRFWDPDTVTEQIDLLVNRYGVRNLKIADEMFVLNRRHVLGICDRLIERGYGLNIWAYTRVDTVKDGMLDKLKAAGFNWLAFGIEAGADRVRAGVDKAIDQDEVYRVLARVRAAGINVIGNYIFGLPEDDRDTMQATLDLALDLNCEFANFYSAMAYPGSPLYGLAVRQGIPLPERWTGYSQHSRDCLPLPTRHVTAGEVLRFRDEAFLRYYTDPGYLAMIERHFGPETVGHIRQMTAYRLERDLLAGTLRVSPAPSQEVPSCPTRS